MKFDESNKVIINSMNQTEAAAFIKFLDSEIARHQMDIDNAYELIHTVSEKFKISYTPQSKDSKYPAVYY